MWTAERDVGLNELLTERERDLLDDFQERMKDANFEYCSSRRFLIRWLRARNWNLADAEKMLRSHLTWRASNNVDTILTDFKVPFIIEKYFPGGICGEDKEGRPLFCVPAGRFDPSSFIKSIDIEDFMRSRIYLMEYTIKVILTQQSERYQKCIDQLTVILDMQNLSWKHMHPSWLPICSEVMTILEANYPEVLGICYVINAPPIFGTVFNFFKPLLNKVTQEKIFVLKSDYQRDLLQCCHPDHLPAIYGGTLTDPDGDPRCPSRISWAGPVPSNLHKQKSIKSKSGAVEAPVRLSTSGKPLKLVELGSNSYHDIYLPSASVGSVISWYISSESHDIAYGLLLKQNSNKSSGTNLLDLGDKGSTSLQSTLSQGLIEILPVKRADTHLTPIEGKFEVQVSGAYFLRLDNSYSWSRSKRVWYHVNVGQNERETTDESYISSPPSCHANEPETTSNLTPPPINNTAEDCKNEEDDTDESSNSLKFGDLSILPIPKETRHTCLLETGGNMDLDVSLLFRFLAQLLILPKLNKSNIAT